MNIFIAHWPVLKERKDYLDDFFAKKSQFKPIYFCNFDKTQLKENELERYYNGFNEFYLNESFENIKWADKIKSQFKGLNTAEVCNFLNHLSIYEYIIENKIEDALILEDDCILPENFDEMIVKIINLKPSECELLFIGGDGTGLTPETYGKKINENQILYKIPTSRTVDAYWLKWKTAFKLYSYIFWKKNFQLPIDWEMNAIINKKKIITYHMYPPLIKQGSAIEQYKSSAR